MMNKISLMFAINSVLSILCVVVVFHLLVLSGIIPSAIVWGGRFKDVAQLRNFEIASAAVNTFLILIVAIRGQYIRVNIPVRMLNIIVWLLVFLFSFNTIANLFAQTRTEAIIFTPITFILALLCFRIAKG